MHFNDLPRPQKKALRKLAFKRNKAIKWHMIFIVIFSIFTATAIASALYPDQENLTGREITRGILELGFMYWGYLSILQPRIASEIRKIRNEL
ncbi:MAG TPA: hypothetical protein VL357_01435 [Rariglobus sp.]|jgi:hypothetical protein|nr:hypothetical protein [Rariglobus sp.]